MSSEIDSNVTSEQALTKKAARKSKPKPAKKAKLTKKSAAKRRRSVPERKRQIIAMMKRPKGATLAEIIAVTGWQTHAMRGFVSILGSKGGEKIESSKGADGERTCKIAKWSSVQKRSQLAGSRSYLWKMKIHCGRVSQSGYGRRDCPSLKQATDLLR